MAEYAPKICVICAVLGIFAGIALLPRADGRRAGSNGCRYVQAPCYPHDSTLWPWNEGEGSWLWYHDFTHMHECYDCKYFEFLGDIHPNCPCRNVSQLTEIPTECFKRLPCTRFTGSYNATTKWRCDKSPKCAQVPFKYSSYLRTKGFKTHEALQWSPLILQRYDVLTDHNCRTSRPDRQDYMCAWSSQNNPSAKLDHTGIVRHISFCAEGMGFHIPTQQKVIIRTIDENREWCSWCNEHVKFHGMEEDVDIYHGYIDYHLTYFRRCEGERCNNHIMDFHSEKPDRMKNGKWKLRRSKGVRRIPLLYECWRQTDVRNDAENELNRSRDSEKWWLDADNYTWWDDDVGYSPEPLLYARAPHLTRSFAQSLPWVLLIIFLVYRF